jgi:Na+/H+-dicarboxylate symporter
MPEAAVGVADAPGKRSPQVLPILAAMAAGALCGWLVGPSGQLLGVNALALFDFLGTLFINLLKMVVVPLVAASVITGVASLGSGRDLGRLGAKTLLFYVLTTLLAILLALALIDLVKPGIVKGEPARSLLALQADAGSIGASVRGHSSVSVGDTLLSFVPTNIFEAAASGQLLPVMFFSLLFGNFLGRIELPYRQVMLDFWQTLFRVMMRITELIMRLAPVGVFALTARVIARAGLNAAGPILTFGACVVAGVVLYALIVLPALLRAVGVGHPYRLFSAMAPALLTAFSTASSAAALPTSLECLQTRAGVPERIARFVMPLGTSINHVGTALYECAGAMFLCQAYGLHLTFGVQLTVVSLALVTSIGIAGIPAAALVAITVILNGVGLPAEGIGVLMVLERILDMLRTSLTVFADAACSVIVARLEGERVLDLEPAGAIAPATDG